jgi:hypothetical protein
MPIVSQGLTLPSNVQTGGTIQASDVATLYQTLNALDIPGTLGVLQQGFVDNNAYTSTGSNGTVDFPFATASNKAIIFLAPFSWTGGTGGNVLLGPRVSGVNASTNSIVVGNVSSGNGLIVGLVAAISTDVDRSGFILCASDRSATTLNSVAFTVTQSTSDRTSIGFISTSSGAYTIIWRGVRFWTEG